MSRSIESRRQGGTKIFSLIGALVVTAVFAIQLSRREGRVPAASVVQTPTEAPTETRTSTRVPDPFENDSPIYSKEDAIGRSLARLPDGSNPTGQFARLLSIEFLMDNSDWYFGEDWNYADPVWLVGIYTTDLVSADVLGESMDAVFGSTPEPVAGAVFIWDANGGLLMSEGPLSNNTSPGERSYSHLYSLPNQNIQIIEATRMPTQELSMDYPEPTTLPPWTATPTP